MAKKILVSFDFGGNEIQNVLLQVLGTPPTVYGAGQVYFDSAIGRPRWYDGTSWNSIDYINDSGTATTDLWSADKIASEIASAVSGGAKYIGGYDANTNTPDLEAPGAGVVKQGYMYTVTAAGTFFTEQVETGDFLIAETDDPAALADWTIVERNLNSATETSEGTTQIATQAEADAGVNDFKYITPLKLKTYLSNLGHPKKFAVDLDDSETEVTRVFAGGITTFTVNHGLNSQDAQVEVYRISDGKTVIGDYERTDANNIDIIGNGNVANDVYRVVIIA